MEYRQTNDLLKIINNHPPNFTKIKKQREREREEEEEEEEECRAARRR